MYIADKLEDWFEENGRNFIWRVYNEPFVILITEILLKKTSANVVDQFLPHFLDRYGNIQTIHDAALEDLIEFLAPLGLSAQRGKQLKDLAKVLVESYDGIVPDERVKLLKLPGVGDYTAGAVLSFAYGKHEPMVDTNVARVIVRIYDIKPSRCEARRSPEVWEKARKIASPRINWALLDIGALICKPRRPKCGECPLLGVCRTSDIQTRNMGVIT